MATGVQQRGNRPTTAVPFGSHIEVVPPGATHIEGAEMFSKSMRLRSIVAAAALVASMVATQVAFSPAAQARCNGSGAANEITSRLIVAGVTYVTEVPVAGTCNGNNLYRADFRANVAGWRATAYSQNNGNWSSSSGAYDTNWVSMTLTDNNSNALIMLCADDGTTWYCGYNTTAVVSTGPSFTFTATNTGF
jgi:hypothetical protein